MELVLQVQSNNILGLSRTAASGTVQWQCLPHASLGWLGHRVADGEQQFRLELRVPLQLPGSLISQHQQLPQNM
jgi:hypothetical protein